MRNNIFIRNAIPSDVDAVIALDLVITQEAKPDYWREVFVHYMTGGSRAGLFLVVETDATVIGFIIGEVRAWEFGSQPCGWVFVLAVSPDVRNMGIGKLMIEELSARWKQAGITTARTMIDRDDKLTSSFFRSMGLRAGRYIELEKQLS